MRSQGSVFFCWFCLHSCFASRATTPHGWIGCRNIVKRVHILKENGFTTSPIDRIPQAPLIQYRIRRVSHQLHGVSVFYLIPAWYVVARWEGSSWLWIQPLATDRMIYYGWQSRHLCSIYYICYAHRQWTHRHCLGVYQRDIIVNYRTFICFHFLPSYRMS